MAVEIHTSPRFPGLIGKKYTKMTPVFQDWDTESLTSRGCVLFNGKYVARPFEKFFNFEELFDSEGRPSELHATLLLHKDDPRLYPKMDGPYRIMDKLDGSLGIAFFWQNEWYVKTAGSFDSPEAIWGTKWLRENLNTSMMSTTSTYCFEILWHDDKFTHPLTHTYEKDELVLIGIVDNETGDELGRTSLEIQSENIGARLADFYEFDDFTKLYDFAKELPSDKEGVVVTFASGFKVKIKGNQFLALQKIYHHITKATVIEHLNGGIVSPEFRVIVPEEMTDIISYIGIIEDEYCRMMACAEAVVKIASAITDRKTAYEFVSESMRTDGKEFIGYVMNRWANKYPKNYYKGFDIPFRKYALAELKDKE